MTRTQNRTLVAALLSLLSILIFSGITSAQPAPVVTGTLRGAVATVVPDGQSYSVPGASLKLKEPTQTFDAVSGDEGKYQFTNLFPGEYTLEATVQGFKTASKAITIRAGETSVENVKLELEDVTGTGVQANETAPAATFKQSGLQNLPLPNEQLLDALPLVPGVIRGPDGQIALNGARKFSPNALTERTPGGDFGTFKSRRERENDMWRRKIEELQRRAEAHDCSNLGSDGEKNWRGGR